jgi:outer membrane receptor for ferrienterochelin and colicin
MRIVARLVLTPAALLCAFCAAALAQPDHGELTGTIIDAKSGRPVAGVTVYVVETGGSAISDPSGAFALDALADGSWHLAVVDPSYQRADIAIVIRNGQPDDAIEIALRPLELVGEEVVVEGDRIRPAPGATTLDRDELAHVPGARSDALTALRSAPGIANTGTPAGGLIIRGSAPADSRIFVDGFEVPILYHFGGIQSVIPTEMIADIIYSPGAYGVEHGRATGGTIEVDTRGGENSYAGFGEVSFINGAAFAKGPIGKELSFAVAVRRSLIDAVLPLFLPNDGSLAFTALPRYYDYQAKLDWRPTTRWHLSLFSFGTDDAMELTSNTDRAEDPLATGRFKTRTFFHRVIASATYQGPSLSNRLALMGGYDTQQFEIGANAERFLDSHVATLAVRDQARIPLGGPFSLQVGGEAELDSVNVKVRLPRPPREGDPSQPNFTFDPIIDDQVNTSASKLAAWSALEVKPFPWLTTTLGVRVDSFPRNAILVLQPRGSARARLREGTTLIASGGLYTRPPDYQDENLDKHLGPERAIQTALGLEQSLGPFSLQLTGFYIDRSNLLVAATDRESGTSGMGVGTYINEGTGRSYGAETLLRIKRDDFFGWLAYTLARSERTDHPGDATRLFDFDQTHNLVLVASWKLGRDKRWRLGGRFQYTSGAPYTPVIGAVYMSDQNIYRAEYGRINSVRNEAQHQLDLRVDRRFECNGWSLSAYLDVANVYMHAPVIDYQYNYDYTQREKVTGLPILPAIGIRGEF